MRKNIACFLIIQSVFLGVSFGQPCDGILNHGIYDFRSTSSSSELASSFISWYKNQNIQTFEDAETASAYASIPLKSIMVGLGFNNGKTDFRDFQSYVESYSEEQFSGKSQFNQTIKLINSEVVKAWEGCIKNKGVHVWIEHTTNPNVFILCANYVDDGGGGTPAKITSIQFEGGKILTSGDIFFNNGQANTKTILNNSIKAQSFTRQNDAPFTIVVNLSRGDVFRYSFSRIIREKIITLAENQNCTYGDCLGIKNIVNIKILSFFLEQRINKRTDCDGPESHGEELTSDIEKLSYGFWRNPQCVDAVQGKWEGKGWHFPSGSCCREPVINGFAAVVKVKAKVTYSE